MSKELSPDCEGCGDPLYFVHGSRPEVDWVKVVCSSCGEINEFSVVRLTSARKK